MNDSAIVKYNSGARTLHWIIAVLIIVNLAIGLLHESVSAFGGLIPLHKSIGLTVLALSLVRLGWRFAWRIPPYPAHVGRREKLVAHGVQAAFYALMILMPLTGWLMSSAGKHPLDWFGLFPVPKLPVQPGGGVAELAHSGHGLLGWLLLALVILHVAAALRHHLILRDTVLRRMA